MSALYAQVIVDVPALQALDYRVPEDMCLAVGDIVRVPVGTRSVAGIVIGLKEWTGIARNRLKAIQVVQGDTVPLPGEWIEFTWFASSYYCRGWGEVALAGIPAFFRKKPGARHSASLEKIRQLPAWEQLDSKTEVLLNPEQRKAVHAVIGCQAFVPWVLFGITGSGKTEVYLRIISHILERHTEGQVLLLVPEINLTPQLEQRVRSFFPRETVVTLNSDHTPVARARSWLAAHEGRARVMVGTRMAIFTSFRNLKLIIVDEEHDLSYKAGDGCRYSARDLAVKRAQLLGIPVMLGSATPSLETWERVKSGKYQLLRLDHRAVPGACPPVLELADLRQEPRPILSARSRAAMAAALNKGEQVLVFLNRRGYSPILHCPACGWVSMCQKCSAGMVFHKDIFRLVCHHCGTSLLVPQRCPECGAVDLLPLGAGTQKIEEMLAEEFPEARILRIDRDSASTKKAAEAAFQKVHKGKVDILLGTQMISKGHDFKRVSLVVVLNTDTQLVSTDIRAKERLFATLVQVAGRAGRAGQPGKIIVETRFPEDDIFKYLKVMDYSGFADAMLKERRLSAAPPFVHQAVFYAEHEDLNQALAALGLVAASGQRLLEERFQSEGIAIYDPVPMPIVRVAGKNRAQLLIESDSRKAFSHFLHSLELPEFPGGSITLEVDPPRI